MHYDPEIPQGGFVSTDWVKRRYAISNSTMYQWIADKHLVPSRRWLEFGVA